MMRRWVVAALLALPVPAGAVERLDGEAIRRAFEGNTVSGRAINGMVFSEYHEPDGRVLGHNGISVNDEGCWTVRRDELCYYYGPPEARIVSCFFIEMSNNVYVFRPVRTGVIDGLAAIEPGNPRTHSDAGKSWSCDGLISRAPFPQKPDIVG